jgi:hypothetical protein
VTLSVAALLAVAGVGVWLMQSEDAAVARNRAALAQTLEARQQAAAVAAEAERARFDAEMAKLKERLSAAASESERERLQAKMTDAARVHARRVQAAKRDSVKKVAASAQPASGPILDDDSIFLGN